MHKERVWMFVDSMVDFPKVSAVWRGARTCNSRVGGVEKIKMSGSCKVGSTVSWHKVGVNK